jgi:hypothetical protein
LSFFVLIHSPDSQHSKSRGDRPEDGERIDKRKLLAIARRNAMYLLREQQERMIQAGVIPGDSATTTLPVDVQGGKTVAELTGRNYNITV